MKKKLFNFPQKENEKNKKPKSRYIKIFKWTGVPFKRKSLINN